MSVKTLFRSFAGGEITPELFGRIELNKFQTGLRQCKNAITLPHGPAVRRPGSVFVARAKFSNKKHVLRPMTFNAQDAVVIEMGDLYARFHTQAGTVVETARNITGMTFDTTITVTHSGDAFPAGSWVFLAGLAENTHFNNRFWMVSAPGAGTFTLQSLEGVNVPGTGLTTYTSGGTLAQVYEVTTPYVEADIARVNYVQSEEVMTLSHPDYPAAELKRVGVVEWTYTEIDFTPTLSPPTGVAVAATIASSTALSPHRYVVTAVKDDGVSESLESAQVSVNNNLTLAGNYNTISWDAVTGADYYNIYKRQGVMAFIGQTSGLSLEDKNILPDDTKTPPSATVVLNNAAGNYPAAVTYHEQRRWFAGTNNRPQTVWATRSGTDSNMSYSLPTQEDDSLEFRVAALQLNSVRHLIPLADLLCLTAGGEWRIYSDNAPALTPFSLSVKPQGYAGASRVQPAVTSGSVLYVQSQGSRVRELAYSWEANSYRSIDAAIMAPHLFDSHQITQLAFSRSPEPILWAVRNDGKLLGFTYVPDQQVSAWHQHDTQGEFESCAVIPEGDIDALYVSVKRVLDGKTVRTIERFPTRFFLDQEDAYFVDCGLRYAGAAVTTLTGLWHLEGEEVHILADGAVEPPQVVENGGITLQAPATAVSVGLPYVTDLETLPLALEQAPAAGQGTLKNVTAVHVRVDRSSLWQAGPSFERLVTYPNRLVADNFGSAPSLRTEEQRVAIPAGWNPDGGVCIRQDQPLPLTVVAIALETQTGG